MHVNKFSYTPAALDADGIAVAGTEGTAGEAFVFAAGFVSGGYNMGDGLAHQITIAPSGSVTGNYEITGTDADGLAQTETLATDTTSTVTSAKYWLTVTEILAPAGIGSETVTIGWNGVSVSPTHLLNWRANSFEVSLAVDISGTINYTVQHCFDKMHDGNNPSTFTWWPHSSIVSKTADTDGNYAFPVTGTRLLVNSVTAGATANFHVIQGDSP